MERKSLLDSDLGFANDGVTDNAQFISKLNNLEQDVIVPAGVFIFSGGKISNKPRLIFEKGATFKVLPDETLFVNSDIEAGHYQIFSGEGQVTTTYKDNNTPVVDYPALTHVKAAWFGVKADAKHPATWGSSTSGKNVIGDLPSGTDSTEALKRACKMAQDASFHAPSTSDLHTICPLELQPNGKIIVKGDNALGSQILNEAIEDMRLMSKRGEEFTKHKSYLSLTRSPFDFSVKGNFCTILFVPLAETDTLIGETTNINQLYVDDLVVEPCGYIEAGYGSLLRNEGIVTFGETKKHFNSLSQQHFNNVRFSLVSGNAHNMGVDGQTNPCGTLFNYTGYGLGDRLRINGGSYRNFEKLINIENPEAVEFKVENTETASYADNSVWYNVPSNYSQFYIENALALMKGDKQTYLRFMADYSFPDGYQNIASASRVQVRSSRLEGGEGKQKTILQANYGQFNISHIDSSTAQGVEHDDSVLADLSGLATADFSHCSLPNNISLDLSMFGSDPNYNQFGGSIRTPMLSLENCTIRNRLRLIQSTKFNGVSYGQALLNTKNKYIPVLKIVESPNVSRGETDYGYYVPLPKYYGTYNSPASYELNELYVPTHWTGKSYPTKNTFGWNLPPFVRISEINLSMNYESTKGEGIKLIIGKDGVEDQYSRIVRLDSLKAENNYYNNVNLIPSSSIATQTDDPEKLFFRILFVDENGEEIKDPDKDKPTIHPSMTINLKYRCLRSGSEIPALGKPAVDITG